jgi:uncharacterized membrane protein YuzA (DUF378 family)
MNIPKEVSAIAFWLAVIGAINIGLGLFGFNIFTSFLGSLGATVLNVVYGAIGVGGLLVGAEKLDLLK